MSAIVTGSEYLRLPRQPETWLVENLLPTSGSMILYGEPKVGKSYAALQLACCLTSGAEWLGFQVPQPARVVYVQLDTPRSLWAARVEALAGAGHPVEGVHFADRETLETHPFNILNPDHFRKITEALMEVKPGAVVIDTLREAHSGDENDSTAMQATISYLEAAVKPASLIVVAHSRKPNHEMGPSLMNDARGSSYVIGRMDGIVRFSKTALRVSSRALEEQSIKILREEDGTWRLDADPFSQKAEQLMKGSSGVPVREVARVLHSMFPDRSEAACRAHLRRLGRR